MAIITLTGSLADITGRPAEQITSATVKAAYAVPSPSGITTSAPRDVAVSSDGSVTVQLEEGVKGWLYVTGPGWTDSIPLIAAAGMSALWHAVANALGIPTDMLGFLDIKALMQQMINDAVAKAPSSLRWNQGRRTAAELQNDARNAPVGVIELWGVDDATALKLPVNSGGLLTTIPYGPDIIYQRYTSEIGGVQKSWTATYSKATGAPVWVPDQWSRTRLNPTDNPNLAAIADGIWHIWTTADATALGMPIAGGGTFESVTMGGTKIQTARLVWGGEVQVWSRVVSAGVAKAWSRIDAGGTNKGRLKPEDNPDLPNLPDGVWGVWTAADATALGLPFSGNGTFESWSFGGAKVQSLHLERNGEFTHWYRIVSAGVAKAWVKIGSSGAGGAFSSRPGSGFKTIPLALTTGTQSSFMVPNSGHYRVLAHWNAPVTRWRLCVTSRQVKDNRLLGADVKLGKVVWGEHSTNGGFKSAPRVLGANITVPGNGGTVRFPWQQDGIRQDTQHILGFDYSTTAEQVYGQAAGGWRVTDSSATDALAPATTLAGGHVALDWYIEAETLATTPVIAVVGDSLSTGAAATHPVVESVLGQYCRKVQALPVHYSGSGENLRQWVDDPAEYKLTRWLHLDAPDAVLFALASNDMAAVPTVAEMKALAVQAVGIVKQLYSPNVYAATVTSRQAYDASTEARRVEYNAWLKSERSLFKDVFDFSAAVFDGARASRIKAEFDGDAVHLTTAGYRAEMEAITRPMTTGRVLTGAEVSQAVTDMTTLRDSAKSTLSEVQAAKLSVFGAALTTSSTPPGGAQNGSLFIDVITGDIYQV